MVARNRMLLLAETCAIALLIGGTATAQNAPVTVRPGVTLPPGYKVLNPGARMQLVRPPSAFVQGPGQAHTNVEILIPKGGYPSTVEPNVGPPQAGLLYQTPASVACAYGLVAPTSGCNPNLAKTNPSGGSKAIAVVDAYDLTTATTDYAKFNAQFGLPAGTFSKVYGTGNPAAGCRNGTAPANASGTGWDVEEDLDIEYAHAMAPSAHLFLVEAASNSDADLYNAEQVATACVRAEGGGQVSNSFGQEEFSGETAYDKYFTGANVVYFASTGDDTYQSYPSTSPYVVAVGGTTFSSNPTSGAYQRQQSWYPNPDYFGQTYGFEGSQNMLGEGAGTSAYEPRPSYQSGVAKLVGTKRGTPDVVAIADPYTGVWIYNTDTYGGWAVIGGTSLASPLVAGISNANGNFFASTGAYLTQLYSLGTQTKLSAYFSKMDSGNCGAPTSPSETGPFYGAYPTDGGSIGSQYQEALNGGILYNECGGWGSPASKAKLP